ncbi:hypothetical protein M2432_001527 [Mycobacterium sp. OTB74]|jgi:hypothetical protein|nr:hypothetical protein [Mycobacterium sp. OTB74]
MATPSTTRNSVLLAVAAAALGLAVASPAAADDGQHGVSPGTSPHVAGSTGSGSYSARFSPSPTGPKTTAASPSTSSTVTGHKGANNPSSDRHRQLVEHRDSGLKALSNLTKALHALGGLKLG